jgi:ABC-type multidrug transport system permease subunit
MEESGFTWSPIYSGLIGGLAVFAIVFFTNSESKRDGNLRLLEFGVVFKTFSLLLIPFTGFILYAMVKSFEGQEIAAILVGTGFLAASMFFPYQAFLIKFGYDDDFIYFKSPIAGDNKVPWGNFERVG